MDFQAIDFPINKTIAKTVDSDSGHSEGIVLFDLVTVTLLWGEGGVFTGLYTIKTTTGPRSKCFLNKSP